MPKMKSKSGAKKRLKVLGNGGVKRSMAFKRHILTKRPQDQAPTARHRDGPQHQYGCCSLQCCPTLKE